MESSIQCSSVAVLQNGGADTSSLFCNTATLLHCYTEHFLKSLTTAARSTISSLTSDLEHFSRFMGNKSLEKTTPQDIQDYLQAQSHLAPSTLARRLSTLRQFYAFLLNEGHMSENPLAGIQQAKKSSLPLSQEEIDLLFAGTHDWDGPEGRRLSALLHIFCLTDISVNDLVSLPLTVEFKLEAVQEYIAVRDHFLGQNKKSPWLFPSSSQKGHLTRQRFGQLLKELTIKVGLDPTTVTLSKIHCDLNKLERN